MRCGPPPQLTVPGMVITRRSQERRFLWARLVMLACVGREAVDGFAGSLHKRHLSTARDMAFFLQWAV